MTLFVCNFVCNRFRKFPNKILIYLFLGAKVRI